MEGLPSFECQMSSGTITMSNKNTALVVGGAGVIGRNLVNYLAGQPELGGYRFIQKQTGTRKKGSMVADRFARSIGCCREDR